MLQAMFSGVSGLQAHQTRMNTIGNNISNVNTTGFKSGRVSFQDQLSQTLHAAAAPASGGTGGVNPAQIGLGVSVGAIDTILTQGNLQSTGKNTDLAVQGNGYFMVSGGNGVQYTRDGSFDMDSSGAIVNPATGMRLLGYQADAFGVIDTSAPITPTSGLTIPVGTLADARQTSRIGVVGNLDAASALYSTKVDFSGNLDSRVTATGPVTTTETVYDSLGNAHTVITTLTNPISPPLAGAGVPLGATQAWDVQVQVDGSSVYDSTAGKSRLYRSAGGAWEFFDPAGTPTTSGSIVLDGTSGGFHGGQVPGTNGAPNVSLDMNFPAALSSTAAASSFDGVANGQAGGTPTWGSSITVYDSLGVGHLITFRYTHVQPGPGAPAGATAQWDWTATENGQEVASSSSATPAGNEPLYFGTNGRVIGGTTQTLRITPTDGSVSPFDIAVDNSNMTQLASDSNATASSQDGYPVGTLQSFSIGPDGVITGVFSSGQTRSLGQVALASFANPGGLDKAGGNLLRETVNSGAAQVGGPNQNGLGKLSTGYLEMSNVDLSNEFTNLIVTQRGFQANTRIITVVDELLQDVINLKR
jgi:flagellar hook protein FlgE